MKKKKAWNLFLISAVFGLCLLVAGPQCWATEEIRFEKYTVTFDQYERLNISFGEEKIFHSSFLPVFVVLPKDEGRDIIWGEAYTLNPYKISASPDGRITLTAEGAYEKKTGTGDVKMDCKVKISFQPSGTIDFEYLLVNEKVEFTSHEIVRFILVPDISGKAFRFSLTDGSAQEGILPGAKQPGMHLVNWSRKIASIELTLPDGKPLRVEFDPSTAGMFGSNGSVFYGDIFDADYQVQHGVPASWKKIPPGSERTIKFRIILP